MINTNTSQTIQPKKRKPEENISPKNRKEIYRVLSCSCETKSVKYF